MSYADKVKEHQRVLKKCELMKEYNVGASIAYYCAFLGIKGYLIDKSFDNAAFLNQNNLSKQRQYSHGTIQRAFIQCLLAHGNTIRNVSKLNAVDLLYKKRKKADYTDFNISDKEFNESILDLEDILNILRNAK